MSKNILKAVRGTRIITREVVNFPSASEASKALGVHVTGISNVCRGNRTKAGGYRWEYVNE